MTNEISRLERCRRLRVRLRLAQVLSTACLTAALCSTATASANPHQLTITTRPAVGMETHLAEAELAFQLTFADPATEPSLHRVGIPGELSLDVVDEPTAIEPASDGGLWFRRTSLESDSAQQPNGSELALEVWPLAEVVAHLPKDLPAGTAITISAERAAVTARGRPRRLDFSAECRRRANRSIVSCPAPAGRHDLRLEISGFVPQVRWDVNVEPGSTVELGSLEARAGASVSGSIVDTAGERGAHVSVELIPLSDAPSRDLGTEDGRRLRRHRQTLHDDLEFLFDGVAIGNYQLEARVAGGASAARIVSILGDRPAVDVGSLTLLPLQTLEVFLEPPAIPGDNEPWPIRLRRPSPYTSGMVDTIAVSETDADGSWKHVSLEPGTYQLDVQAPSGGTVANREIVIDGTQSVVFIDLELVALSGVLSLDDEPRRGTLHFGGKSYRDSVVMAADAEGRFDGLLPHAGEWSVDIELATGQVVELEPIDIGDDGDDDLEIELPVGKAIGWLVDGSGDPVEGGIVFVESADTGRELAHVAVRGDDPVDIEALPPGEVELTGYDPVREISTEPTRLTIPENASIDAEFVLVLREGKEIRGVVHHAGQSLPDARVTAFASDASGRLVSSHQASFRFGSGYFSVEVPQEATRAVLLASSPGLPASLFPVALSSGDGQEATPDVELTLSNAGGRMSIHFPTDIEPAGQAILATAVVRSEATAVPVSLLLSILRPAASRIEGGIDFQLPPMAAGGYALCWPGEQGCTAGDLASGSELTLRFTELPGWSRWHRANATDTNPPTNSTTPTTEGK